MDFLADPLVHPLVDQGHAQLRDIWSDKSGPRRSQEVMIRPGLRRYQTQPQCSLTQLWAGGHPWHQSKAALERERGRPGQRLPLFAAALTNGQADLEHSQLSFKALEWG